MMIASGGGSGSGGISGGKAAPSEHACDPRTSRLAEAYQSSSVITQGVSRETFRLL